MGGEIVPGEQRVKDGLGDEVLGEHRDRILAPDAVVEVVAQPLRKVSKRRTSGEFFLRIVEDGVDAQDLALGDIGDIGRPVLPVSPRTDFVDDAGVDGLLPVRRGEQRDLLGRVGRAIGICSLAPGVRARLA